MSNQVDCGIAKNLQQMGLKPAFDEGQKEGKFKISNCLTTHNSQQRGAIDNVSQIEESQQLSQLCDTSTFGQHSNFVDRSDVQQYASLN